jgi:hypothetical protein
MDPAFQPLKPGKFTRKSAGFSLQTPEMRVSGRDLRDIASELRFDDAAGKQLLTVVNLQNIGATLTVVVQHAAGEALYGMRGTDRNQKGSGTAGTDKFGPYRQMVGAGRVRWKGGEFYKK